MSIQKKAVGAVLLWWLFSGSSSTKSTATAKKSPAPPGKPKKTERPQAGPLVPDLGPEAEAEAPKPPKKKPSPDRDEAESSEKDRAKGAKKKGPSATNDEAAELAENFFVEYTKRGIEDPMAAAECLTLYLLAGGNDPAIIKRWQKVMGVTESGEYDKETSTIVAKDLDMAIDGAINGLIQGLFAGENPPEVAGKILLQYMQEAKDIGALLPREKIAALQLNMGVRPLSGAYDDNTRARLVELGITPTEVE